MADDFSITSHSHEPYPDAIVEKDGDSEDTKLKKKKQRADWDKPKNDDTTMQINMENDRRMPNIPA
jgi:hypothetical protein